MSTANGARPADLPYSTPPDTTNKRRPLEISREGVFAIGDVRSGSVKRVAAAVGEGAQVVRVFGRGRARAGRCHEPLRIALGHTRLVMSHL